MWIDCQNLKVGHLGFLVEFFNKDTGNQCHILYHHPPRKGNPYMPKGWRQINDNISITELGVFRVVGLVGKDRANVIEMRDPAQILKFLEQYGLPELIQRWTKKSSLPRKFPE